MTVNLIYVVGPSGAGKDSLLGWVKARLPRDSGVAFARRTITRASHPGDEDHESLGAAAFLQLREAGAFALDWEANGLFYGIRKTELMPFSAQSTFIVNGSRAHLEAAAARHPGLTVVRISAQLETLRQRLGQRGRETPEQVEQRVRRSLSFQMPADIPVFEIPNDGPLEEGGAALRDLVLRTASTANDKPRAEATGLQAKPASPSSLIP